MLDVLLSQKFFVDAFLIFALFFIIFTLIHLFGIHKFAKINLTFLIAILIYPFVKISEYFILLYRYLKDYTPILVLFALFVFVYTALHKINFSMRFALWRKLLLASSLTFLTVLVLSTLLPKAFIVYDFAPWADIFFNKTVTLLFAIFISLLSLSLV